MRRCNYDACQIRHEDDQADRDRLATENISELADLDDGAIVDRQMDNDVTDRVQIASMDARLAELVDAHDATAPLFPEFGPRTEAQVYSLDDYRAGLDVTRTDWPAMPDREPSWGQVLRMAAEDVGKAIKEVL